MEIEEIGNNLFEVNGERIYAPNVSTAIQRYEERFSNDNIIKHHEQRTNDREASEDLPKS